MMIRTPWRKKMALTCQLLACWPLPIAMLLVHARPTSNTARSHQSTHNPHKFVE